ncbi:MAG: DUF4870 domain-containing protein [Bacteroidetes bacterium]|nr:MAG: DUF4870 domain-containing protein [Bacteroidota bacterium]
MDTGYHPLPQPEELPQRDKEDAMGAYLMMFAALGAGLPLPIINLIAAVIYYYINKKASRFVRFHTHQALISQIPTTLMNAIAVFWGLRILIYDDWGFTNIYKGYLVAVLLANILYFIFGIIGAIKANSGKMYYLLFFGKISYHSVFQIRPDEDAKAGKQENLPPKF